ncbi:MAG: PQQ-binding-like beta-propeller repeat protein, partial [Proteobacteria bacterium]|nr:PQQ-binding-like beta-propeller repeat protein [Pseudomonadota bacterium]
KILFFIIILLPFVILFDFVSINYKYVNRSLIEISEKNINSTFLKKIYNFFGKKYENLLITIPSENKKYWLPEDINYRNSLPETKIITAGTSFTRNINPYSVNLNDWERSHGNENSNRFSDLNLINTENIKNLDIAWAYRSKDRHESKFDLDVQCNPIVVDGKIYTPTAGGGRIVSIDGFSGKEIWRTKKLHDDVARRGLQYWKGNNIIEPRIYATNFKKLIAINAKTGNFIKEFGKNGIVKIKPSSITPIIYQSKIIVVTFDKTVEVYDLVGGKLIWKLDFQKKYFSRAGGVKYNNEGSNPWGGISADLQRGILYITTGNPHSYFDGTRRPGPNESSDSIIAVDLNEKKILWSFQETEHDIWNLDIPAPPILTSIIRNNNLIDVVIAVTKRANTLMLDRVTGKPIFDMNYKKAPTSKIPGEKTAPYQLDLRLPEPFAKNIFSQNEITNLTATKRFEIKERIKNFKYGFFEPVDTEKKTIIYNFHGGAEWMGASVDHQSQTMYVTANNVAFITDIIWDSQNKKYISRFERLLDSDGYLGNVPPWGTLTSLNLNTGKIIWQVPFGEFERLTKQGISRTGTENFGGATATKGELVFATGTLDKMIYAFKSTNGEEVWKMQLPFIGSAPPTTYVANGEQFIIVQSTGSYTLRSGYSVERGDALVAFKLKK